ncbi:hypothetical protein [Psychrobacillus antarcticus]|uniref:hypothetical protein n=1 Tax=Psychrobacillus antarcticus TaxID=2879115 RepID=UPI0024088FFC|nr:hypothetical protein [Psychrobacillus antarcticus]
MWKKAVPAVALCSILLVGCNNNGAVPKNNETPMQDVREDINTPSPNTNNGMNNNGNGTLDNGNVNDGINNNGAGVMDGTENVPNDGKLIEEPITERDNNDEVINNNTNNIK